MWDRGERPHTPPSYTQRQQQHRLPHEHLSGGVDQHASAWFGRGHRDRTPHDHTPQIDRSASVASTTSASRSARGSSLHPTRLRRTSRTRAITTTADFRFARYTIRMSRGAARTALPSAMTAPRSRRASTPNLLVNGIRRRSLEAEAKPSEPSGVAAKESKKSRYLREMDRRSILGRLAKGERQSDLAKEYHVSRSTICNLYKQRDLVLARTDENPLCRHPKKPRRRVLPAIAPARLAAQIRQVCGSVKTGSSGLEEKAHQRASAEPSRVIDVKSPAIALLKAVLQNRKTPREDFLRCSERLMRLLLEESLVVVSSGDSSNNQTDDEAKPTEPPHPFPKMSAVSMEHRGHAMLDAVTLIEPQCATGVLGFPSADGSTPSLHGPRLPHNLGGYQVVLLDVTSASGDTACAAIHRLRSRGAEEAHITLVTLVVTAEVVEHVQCVYPQVRIVMTSVIARIRPQKLRPRNAGSPLEPSLLERFSEMFS